MIRSLLVSLILSTALSGCLAIAAGGVAGTGYTVAQERSVGSVVDDNAIWTKIKSAFLQHDVNDLFGDVNVEVSEGRVLLTGDVRSPQTRVDAVRITWQVSGVKEVINEIQVTDQTTLKNYANDLWIITQVKSRLLLEKNLRSINYSVDCINATVYLMGIAQDQNELNRATIIAGKVKGVKNVISHVRLRQDPLRS